MKARSSIRWKIILLFVISIGAAVVSVLLLMLFALYLTGNVLIFRVFFRFLYRWIGVVPLGLLAGIVLFLVYFFILTQRSIRYLEEISDSLEQISKGKLDIRIPIKTTDELGVLAQNINYMTKQLKESIEEERNAEKTKTELITSVSHDLRTPLTSILGYLDLIVHDRYHDEVALRYYADIAYSKSLRLKNLIDELFEYTRVSYGGMNVSLKRLNIVELMEQLVEEFVPLLQEADMICRLSPAKKEIFTEVDANLIVRVFENLIMNAIRYGKEGKYLDIELTEDTDIFIRVINYGEPIPSKDLPYLFERFYRVEKSRSEEMGGTGLGLAIVKSIVELHDGEIAAYSDQNRTVFELKLKHKQEKTIL
ncbi:sensor histidine kinase [Geosporobacter ferrireducens]|uniref:sensor histidine kinase n=1 Tax=Geosporobacter ferrireducens TaxID=1424294 RepID=UPI000B0644F3|nr:HAMP domain-containing sensor histidine kinase [Geosporobacter ferrireducens]